MVRRWVIRAELAVEDEDFRRLLTAIGTLTPEQLVTLDASIRARLVTATAAASISDEQPAASVAGRDSCASLADIDAPFAQAPVCPRCQGTAIGKMGLGQRPQVLSLHSVRRHIQHVVRDAACAAAQPRVVAWAWPGAARPDQLAQGGGAARYRSDHGVPPAAPVPLSAERLETEASNGHRRG